LLLVILAAIWPLAQWKIEQDMPRQVSQIESPGSIAGWPAAQTTFTDWIPVFDKASASLQSTFQSDGRMVGLYLGYYRNQDYRRKMVSSNDALVRGDDLQWSRVTSGTRQITVDQQPVFVRTAELRSTDSSRMVVWQWYWVNGHLTASDVKAKAYTALSRLTGQGDDSAVIIVYAPKEQADGDEVAMEAFVRAAGPEIAGVLSRTREVR
jgi:EpsI family protein